MNLFTTTVTKTKSLLVIRTDFSNEAIWENICATLGARSGDFFANVKLVDDARYSGATKDQLLRLIHRNCTHHFMVIVDRTAISNPEHPLLIVALLESFGHEFRAIPSAIQGIKDNLSIARLGFENLADAIDGRGVFRGFHECRL
jgi:hypothetical protein